MVLYSGLSKQSYYGGTRPAEAFKEVVNELYAMNPQWRETIDRQESMPQFRASLSAVDKSDPEIVPDVMGLGLNEAIYKIENSGYQCRFSGVGHVKEQSPASGKDLKKGGTISIRLE